MLRKKLESSISKRLAGCDLLTLMAVHKALNNMSGRRPQGVKKQIIDLLELEYDDRVLEVIKRILLKN